MQKMKFFRPVTAMIMMIGIFAVTMNIISPYVTTLAEEMQTDTLQFRNIFALYYFGFALTSIIAGSLAHIFSNKFLVMAGGIIVSLGLFIFWRISR